MALGKRRTERQEELWIAAEDLARTPRHVFYEKLNQVLAKGEFDAWLEAKCAKHYAQEGRPSVPPGVYFRMLLIGYFEGIDSQRGIAWRCADSLSLKKFLGFGPTESTPDHSSLTYIRRRLPLSLFQDVFRFVLELADRYKLLSGTVVGVDSTTLEANAAMKAIVRRDTGENWPAYITRLMEQEGVIEAGETPSAEEIRRFDKKRKDKTASNEEWTSPADPDARIAKMKDGRTHLAYKAEHVVDLKTEVIVSAEVYHADQGDQSTLADSLERAQENLDEAAPGRQIEKVAADKGYHSAESLAQCRELGLAGVKTYIPEPELNHARRWTDKPEEHQEYVYANRQRVGREYGKKLQRRRSEVVERGFAHVCDTGGARRSWLRGIENVNKRHLISTAAHNLGLILRKLLGSGKPREFGDLWRLWQLLQNAPFSLWRTWGTLVGREATQTSSALTLLSILWCRRGKPASSTGC